MGFIDVLKRNGYEVKSNGHSVVARKNRQAYKYSLNLGELHNTSRGPTRVYFDGEEAAYDFIDHNRRRRDDGGRESAALRQLGILHDDPPSPCYGSWDYDIGEPNRICDI